MKKFKKIFNISQHPFIVCLILGLLILIVIGMMACDIYIGNKPIFRYVAIGSIICIFLFLLWLLIDVFTYKYDKDKK
ncbi:hypothetical protein NPA07_03285 [Mycoplasmopsis caviae]|uniref:Uncharacterized protein n=1 Tax=Mycoplasmopsis caviae TaxID=55603 RepID=A0ABY5IZ13_9BACT|nr:hypothetical protein [Mycoplasmopsis caviae]UUD34820.1 hypothetical protein NPA07_03285 [Mycoplasmopsis caviae]